MLKINILFILTLIISSMLTKFLRNKYNIIDPQRIRYVSNTHQWVEIPLVVLGVIFIFLFWFIEVPVLFYIAIAIFTVVSLFRAFVEYKYEREEKEYIITLLDFGIWSISMGVLLVYYISTLD
ncbi:hypothetical protein NCCP2222_02840 [Sporosarcina sp. NCCP-2222]|uniref:DUF4181 domain-containing protein n=1 Tax=Sporosarcina sp. NCCP-2222 TaxID=2935073 RepID=UPI0020899411|nr:DUF4181 domain-containing protein [Sporosarcina sp. NCCP-2222]GKV54337.1 hypothetical protein NCCP2222_02840 [Sporosarcina sp. NCCP-2222]